MKKEKTSQPEQTKNLGGRPPKYTDNTVLSKRIDEYFIDCDSRKDFIKNDKGDVVKIIYKPYTISGLCLWLDLTNETLLQYEKDDRFSETIKRAKKRVENWLEEKSLAGETNPTVSIFNLKNNFGWKDKSEHELTGKDGGAIQTENISIDLLNASKEDLLKLKEARAVINKLNKDVT